MSSRRVLLVHGIFDTGAIFGPMQRALEKRGCDVTALDLRPSGGEVGLDVLGQQVEAEVSTGMLDRSGSPVPFALVAFSMGGLVCRYYLQRLGGLGRVVRFVTLATPHRGSLWARLTPRGVGRPGIEQMRPGSPFLRDLDRDAERLAEARLVSIWTPYDLMIVPPSSAAGPLANGRVVGTTERIQVVAHPLMTRSERVIESVVRALDTALWAEGRRARRAGCRMNDS